MNSFLQSPSCLMDFNSLLRVPMGTALTTATSHNKLQPTGGLPLKQVQGQGLLAFFPCCIMCSNIHSQSQRTVSSRLWRNPPKAEPNYRAVGWTPWIRLPQRQTIFSFPRHWFIVIINQFPHSWHFVFIFSILPWRKCVSRESFIENGGYNGVSGIHDYTLHALCNRPNQGWLFSGICNIGRVWSVSADTLQKLDDEFQTISFRFWSFTRLKMSTIPSLDCSGLRVVSESAIDTNLFLLYI